MILKTNQVTNILIKEIIKLIFLHMNIDELNQGSQQFVIRTQTLKRKFWWKNVKVIYLDGLRQ
jgi:putative NIF3 family GTP cyclohydrolase 1 type 2